MNPLFSNNLGLVNLQLLAYKKEFNFHNECLTYKTDWKDMRMMGGKSFLRTLLHRDICDDI